MNVAFIPVRGGSKSIPLKNIKILCGKPLVYWVCKAACKSDHIDEVYVATDSREIVSAITNFIDSEPNIFRKLKLIGRSPESASDTASTEFAMLEFANNYIFDNIILIQATSPLIKSEDIDRGFELFETDGTDSVLSVVRQKRFFWNINEQGFAVPENYDVYNRPRRQEFFGNLIENGAFYITSKKALLESRNRLSGNIKAVEMSPESYIEIDEPEDFEIIEKLMKRKSVQNYSEIKMFLSDCDGCLTDGGMYYSEKGDELKKFNTKDGVAFSILKKNGIITGIVTGENVNLNKRRAEKLGLDIYIGGCKDKLEEVKKLCSKYDISMNQILYVGDDINDKELLSAVGIGCCPVDACAEIREISQIITKAKGGNAVIREIVDNMFA